MLLALQSSLRPYASEAPIWSRGTSSFSSSSFSSCWSVSRWRGKSSHTGEQRSTGHYVHTERDDFFAPLERRRGLCCFLPVKDSPTVVLKQYKFCSPHLKRRELCLYYLLFCFLWENPIFFLALAPLLFSPLLFVRNL